MLALRAEMDLIVIGAETLRRDNPSLATRGTDHFAARKAAGRPPHPAKMVISRSGDIPLDRAFFRTGDGERIVLSQVHTDAPGTIIVFDGDPIAALVNIAKDRDFRNVMIEGGAQILRLARPHARFLRLAVSPKSLGAQGHARLTDDLAAFLDAHVVTRTETLDDTTVHHIDLLATRASPLMKQAFDLSEQCPLSSTAFAVGAIGCDEQLNVLATGYSRETGPTDHAEEALLSKLDAVPHTVICTLEPCLTRASKPTGCAQRLVDAGVRRVFYSVAEDDTFTRQSGLAHLRDHRVELIHIPGFETRFREVNATLYER